MEASRFYRKYGKKTDELWGTPPAYAPNCLLAVHAVLSCKELALN